MQQTHEEYERLIKPLLKGCKVNILINIAVLCLFVYMGFGSRFEAISLLIILWLVTCLVFGIYFKRRTKGNTFARRIKILIYLYLILSAILFLFIVGLLISVVLRMGLPADQIRTLWLAAMGLNFMLPVVLYFVAYDSMFR